MNSVGIPTVTTTANHLSQFGLGCAPVHLFHGLVVFLFLILYMQSQQPRTFQYLEAHCTQTSVLPKRNLNYYSPRPPHHQSAYAGKVWACTLDFWGGGHGACPAADRADSDLHWENMVLRSKAKTLEPDSLGLNPGSVI